MFCTRGSMPASMQKPKTVGNASGKRRADRGTRVEPDGAPALLLLEDRARDDVARRQLGVGMKPEHEAFAQIVDERRAFAAHRLGDQRHRIASDRKRGRMELHELHIGEHRAGARRHRDAVAGRLHGIGRVAVEPAHAAGGEHDGARRGTRSRVARRVVHARRRRRRARSSRIRSSAMTSSTTRSTDARATASISVLRIS